MAPRFIQALAAPRQGSFDDLGTPLCEVTFAVVDLETTGTAPGQSRIIEVGAAKFRGGECLGTFQTLVNPGCAIPPFIVVLTGITEALVVPAPAIEEVLPSLLEFLGDAVLVGHNLRFDTSFLDVALAATGRPRLSQPRVDTLALARRLVRDEVPDLRLSTLARLFRTATQPTHRALDDVLATAGVFHGLLERAGCFGVLGLDDLLALPSTPLAMAKLPLAAGLPRRPGVYLFKDAGGRVLYVGKATNLRARVRSYFSSDDRRKVPQLLRETAAIDHVVCAHPLEAAVLELRLIQAHQPRFNRRGKAWRAYAYLKLTAERFPRLAVVHEARNDGAFYLGPFHSSGAAPACGRRLSPPRRCGAARCDRGGGRGPRVPRASPPSSAWPAAPAAGGRARPTTPPWWTWPGGACGRSRPSSSSPSPPGCGRSPPPSASRRPPSPATGSPPWPAPSAASGFSTGCGPPGG